MSIFIVKPGEAIRGIGFNFTNKLSSGEIISSTEVVPGPDLTVLSISNSGAISTADIGVDFGAEDGETFLDFTITGSLGSIRKARRVIIVRALSE